ncbi:restriction endonuclease [Microbulbifer sp. JTAC008]|uniref:restriction endonuclease n=1 Tax=Microbulbifer sp. JTAC008 TaxID=3243374 RepID=UPI00403A08A7
MTEIISTELSSQDLFVDAVYGGSRKGNYSDDPLPALLSVDNGAGFRCLGSPRTEVDTLKLLVLQTDFSNLDWPDELDIENGLFTYYGDKRGPGDLHDTKRDGNKIFRSIFEYCHGKPSPITAFPPILLFGKTGTYRDTKFLGLAVPGAKSMSSDEDLTAIWRTSTEGIRFQNYRATFTILNVPVVSRSWIRDAQNGLALTSPHAPKPWLDWINKREYDRLVAERTVGIRSTKEQTNLSTDEQSVISSIYNRFKDSPTGFESLAADLVGIAMPNAHNIEITRPWRDGGKDATGKYRICRGASGIDVDFAMEAKCYAINNGVGVKEISRLISRLRHRQFGVLVTTSYLASQAYKELKSDEHPVVILSAIDIAKLLLKKLGHPLDVQRWLEKNY